MQTIILGSGSPLVTADRAGPATLVRVGKTDLLFDCGRAVLMRGAAVGMTAAELTALFVTHMHSDHSPVHPTMGFRVEAEGKAVAIAGDTVPCEGLNRLCADADIYVQTVILRSFIETHPSARFRDVIDYHSDVVQAAQTAKACRVRTLVLNHPVPPPRPGTESAWIDLARAHFDGTVVLANDLLSLEA